MKCFQDAESRGRRKRNGEEAQLNERQLIPIWFCGESVGFGTIFNEPSILINNESRLVPLTKNAQAILKVGPDVITLVNNL